jgi:hypothetical protein
MSWYTSIPLSFAPRWSGKYNASIALPLVQYAGTHRAVAPVGRFGEIKKVLRIPGLNPGQFKM